MLSFYTREQMTDPKFHNIFENENVNIIGFYHYFWNPHKECIQISINMHSTLEFRLDGTKINGGNEAPC